ncbi:hypothetical protein BGZ79_004688 [Entomortierella chlamydospora]|nr:hypothetical protein BGZ79_004688 [Entomortierella chlamydospora]
MNNLQAGGLIDIGNSDINFESNCGSRSELPSIPSLDPASSAESRHFSPELMDLDNGPVFFRRAALLTPGITIKGEGGPVTIEIENLHPSTTAEDVMVACSRYGEIQTCMCSSGYAQVTYFKKIAGLAAISMLDGKYSDNDQILRVTMRETPVIHCPPAKDASSIAKRFKSSRNLNNRKRKSAVTRATASQETTQSVN